MRSLKNKFDRVCMCNMARRNHNFIWSRMISKLEEGHSVMKSQEFGIDKSKVSSHELGKPSTPQVQLYKNFRGDWPRNTMLVDDNKTLWVKRDWYQSVDNIIQQLHMETGWQVPCFTVAKCFKKSGLFASCSESYIILYPKHRLM